MRRFQPSLDTLDRRDVPASVSLVGGALNISAGEGTQYGLAFVYENYQNPNLIEVMAIDGNNTIITEFNKADITSMNINLSASGQYSFNEFYSNVPINGNVTAVNAEHNVMLDMGLGNYTFSVPDGADNLFSIR